MHAADVCATPVPANHSIKLRPPNCVSSNQSAEQSACSAHRSALLLCPIVLSHTSTLSVQGGKPSSTNTEHLVGGSRQRRLVAALSVAATTNALAIVGDSMARQAFMALVARLRGQDHALDYNVQHPLRFTLHVTPPVHGRQHVVDALNIPHRRQLLPQLDLPLSEWAARMASTLGRASHAKRGADKARCLSFVLHRVSLHTFSVTQS